MALTDNLSDMNIAELQSMRRKLAKQMNQRLVRLEDTKSQYGDESYASVGAGRMAYKYLQTQGRKPTTRETKLGTTIETYRFSENLNYTSDRKQLELEIEELQSLIDMKSSSIKENKRIEKARNITFDKMLKKKGLEVKNYKEFYNFLNSSDYKVLAKILSSEQIIEMRQTLESRQKNGKPIDADEQLSKLIDLMESRRVEPSIKGIEKALNVKLTRIRKKAKTNASSTGKKKRRKS